MKTIFAKEKSEYLHSLIVAINLNLHQDTRSKAIQRMAELEAIVKNQGDELQIVITSKNTEYHGTAPPMSMADIKNQ